MELETCCADLDVYKSATVWLVENSDVASFNPSLPVYHACPLCSDWFSSPSCFFSNCHGPHVFDFALIHHRKLSHAKKKRALTKTLTRFCIYFLISNPAATSPLHVDIFVTSADKTNRSYIWYDMKMHTVLYVSLLSVYYISQQVSIQRFLDYFQ